MSSARSGSRSSRSGRDRVITDQGDKLKMASHFITVKYGENKEAILNAWCTGHTLTNYIRKKCACEKDVMIDLCDLEGNMRQLPNRQYEYANTYIDGRRTYILVKVDKQGENEPDKYSFLLKDIETLHPDVSDKVKQLQTSKFPSDKKKEKPSAKLTWGTMRAMTRVNSRISKSRDSSRRNSRDVTKS